MRVIAPAHVREPVLEAAQGLALKRAHNPALMIAAGAVQTPAPVPAPVLVRVPVPAAVTQPVHKVAQIIVQAVATVHVLVDARALAMDALAHVREHAVLVVQITALAGALQIAAQNVRIAAKTAALELGVCLIVVKDARIAVREVAIPVVEVSAGAAAMCSAQDAQQHARMTVLEAARVAVLVALASCGANRDKRRK